MSLLKAYNEKTKKCTKGRRRLGALLDTCVQQSPVCPLQPLSAKHSSMCPIQPRCVHYSPKSVSNGGSFIMRNCHVSNRAPKRAPHDIFLENVLICIEKCLYSVYFKEISPFEKIFSKKVFFFEEHPTSCSSKRCSSSIFI